MFDTQEKKKSLLITIGLFIALFLLLFFFGLSYLDPATEQGIAINFGTSETGSGKTQPTKTVKTAPSNTTAQEIKTTQTTTETPSASQPVVEEKVITQTTNDAPVIKSSEKKKKTITPTEKKDLKKNTKKATEKKASTNNEVKKTVKPVEKKPDASTKNALDSFLNGAKQNGETTQGEGNDNAGGDKGKINGDPNAKAYYGTGKGLDGDGNYRLGGRKALNKERKIPTCNETGIVVVKIVVNQQGKVIEAYPGIKGTTNTAPCLMQPAKIAALTTKFNSDSNAPSKQIGSIVYEFKLSE